MLSPVEFLREECDNVDWLLRHTLRYAYSAKSSTDVHDECVERLRLIRSQLVTTTAGDQLRIDELAANLSELSELIGRVGRSHIEEFSWPFADELQRLATHACALRDATDDPPLFLISADDDLSSYQIHTEADDPGLIVRPIFNIVFPTALKLSVLIHPILGHEVGHAAYAIPELGGHLDENVTQVLISKSALTDITKLQAWATRGNHDLSLDDLTHATGSWPEELYCDLFGLLTMGPSYLAANATYLLGLAAPSYSHPGSLTRHWLLQQALTHLGWEHSLTKANRRLKQAIKDFFRKFREAGGYIPTRQRLIRAPAINAAVDALEAFLASRGAARFSIPNDNRLESMVDRIIKSRPPVETSVSRSLDLHNDTVDFREILLAGWLAYHDDRLNRSAINFHRLNRLCDRAILQQSAITHWSKYLSRRPTNDRS